jgi:hypothetical protein
VQLTTNAHMFATCHHLPFKATEASVLSEASEDAEALISGVKSMSTKPASQFLVLIHARTKDCIFNATHLCEEHVILWLVHVNAPVTATNAQQS